MTDHQLSIQMVQTSELNGYEGNARRGDVDAIAESLEVNGQYRPIIVNRGTLTGKPNEVLAGNHTLKAARQLEWPSVAVTFVDVDENAARRIVLADNKTNDLASYDNAELLSLLKGMDNDLAGTGFVETDVLDLMETLDTGYGAPGSAGMVDPEDDDYQEQYGVIVVAHSEGEQRAIFEELQASGYTVKVVTV